ncbi:MAG: type I-E CRISPR-associated protein Cas6/Cse3/CasE [Acidobacteriota bacterium]
MYLSCLMVDVGRDPDRPRPGRLWLRNLYHVHQRLCMGFHSGSRKAKDPLFLAPFKPEDFSELGDVHAPRSGERGFLYRLDPRPGCAPVIVVQSAAKPDWDYAFQNATFLLAAPPQLRSFDTTFVTDERLRFRLLANPTRKIDTKSGPDRKRRHGKRVPVAPERLLEWLSRKGEAAGFVLDEGSTSVQAGFIGWRKPGDSAGQKIRSVRFDGILTVSDSGLLGEALLHGLGPGKAFGFGLLSVAPCSTGGN